jgi:shikimate kinase
VWHSCASVELGHNGHQKTSLLEQELQLSDEKPLRIALIGMSGTGKSYWTQRVAAAGYPAISCDALIEKKLQPVLQAGGFSGINGVAAWMGWPDSQTYAEREAQYLAEETESLDELLTELQKQAQRSLILDTTGSIIYTGNHLLHRLRKLMTVVYLAASADEQQLLIRRYLEDPKPVLWRGAFQSRAGETPHQTVARCYPQLIVGRRQSYEALAHCVLPVADLRGLSLRSESAGSIGEGFLDKVRKQMAHGA